MRISNLMLMAAIGLMASSTVASAQPAGSAYYGGHFGLNLTDDSSITEPTVFYGDTATFGTGFAFGGFVGYDTGAGIRVEGEMTLRSNSLDEFSGLPGLGFDGGIDSFALMANAFYDLDLGSNLRPYIGGGIGIAFMSTDISFLGTKVMIDDDTVMAYQLGAGVGYEISRTVTVTVDYRLFATEDPMFRDNIGVNIEFEHQSQSILIGVRTAF